MDFPPFVKSDSLSSEKMDFPPSAKRDNNKIAGIDGIGIITNGTPLEMEDANPHQIGYVINELGQNISQITPMIMIINQGLKNYKEILDIMIKNGGDIDQVINYYGRETTAREIATLYRDY